jgi:hypothetical protein
LEESKGQWRLRSPLDNVQKGTAEKEIELTAEQVAFIEKHNPYFKERHVESSRPRELRKPLERLAGKCCGSELSEVALDEWKARRSR